MTAYTLSALFAVSLLLAPLGVAALVVEGRSWWRRVRQVRR